MFGGEGFPLQLTIIYYEVSYGDRLQANNRADIGQPGQKKWMTQYEPGNAGRDKGCRVDLGIFFRVLCSCVSDLCECSA